MVRERLLCDIAKVMHRRIAQRGTCILASESVVGQNYVYSCGFVSGHNYEGVQ
jgi:hypothetical protein